MEPMRNVNQVQSQTLVEQQMSRFSDYNTTAFNQAMNTSTTTRQFDTVVGSRSRVVSSQVARTNLVGRVRLVALVSIIALLGFLLIYNAIAIGALTASIAMTEAEIVAEQQSVNELKQQLNELNNEESIMKRVEEAGFSSNVSAVDTSGYEVVKSTPITYESQSNWFDRVCEFISSLFGG